MFSFDICLNVEIFTCLNVPQKLDWEMFKSRQNDSFNTGLEPVWQCNVAVCSICEMHELSCWPIALAHVKLEHIKEHTNVKGFVRNQSLVKSSHFQQKRKPANPCHPGRKRFKS